MSIVQYNDTIIIDGVELPKVPNSDGRHYNSTIINGKPYVNGYAWDEEKREWVKKPKAVFISEAQRKKKKLSVISRLLKAWERWS